MKIFPLTLAFIALVSGCATPGIFVEVSRPVQESTALVHCQAAHVSDDVFYRTDGVGGPNKNHHIRTGEILSRVFSGGPQTPQLQIEEVKGRWSLTDVGFTSLFTFTIKATLNGRPLVAGGIERAHGSQGPGVYSQIAFERAAVDLANQVSVIQNQRPINGQ